MENVKHFVTVAASDCYIKLCAALSRLKHEFDSRRERQPKRIDLYRYFRFHVDRKKPAEKCKNGIKAHKHQYFRHSNVTVLLMLAVELK